MAMRKTLMAAAVLLSAGVLGRGLLAQTVLPNGQYCQCPACQQALAARQPIRPANYAEQQSVFGSQASFLDPGYTPIANIHWKGYRKACPACSPGAYGQGLGGGAYEAGPHSLGTGNFPYGSQYDAGHPGMAFDGGYYGYFGGAHRTPGYPHHHFNREYVGPQGPPTAQVAYPYYTTRGPRDFLIDNPPSIGR